MTVARHPDLSNPNHGSDLPPSWRTLAVLAQLPAGEIPTRIKAHEITPRTSRWHRWVLVVAVLVGMAGGTAVAVPLGHAVAVAQHERPGR